MNYKLLTVGIVACIAIVSSFVSLNEPAMRFDRDLAGQIYGASCYKTGNIAKKYCSFWCGYSGKVLSVVEVQDVVGNVKRDFKPCKNSTTCAYKMPKLNGEPCTLSVDSVDPVDLGGP